MAIIIGNSSLPGLKAFWLFAPSSGPGRAVTPPASILKIVAVVGGIVVVGVVGLGVVVVGVVVVGVVVVGAVLGSVTMTILRVVVVGVVVATVVVVGVVVATVVVAFVDSVGHALSGRLHMLHLLSRAVPPQTDSQSISLIHSFLQLKCFVGNSHIFGSWNLWPVKALHAFSDLQPVHEFPAFPCHSLSLSQSLQMPHLSFVDVPPHLPAQSKTTPSAHFGQSFLSSFEPPQTPQASSFISPPQTPSQEKLPIQRPKQSLCFSLYQQTGFSFVSG
jgi:hypothetical protein